MTITCAAAPETDGAVDRAALRSAYAAIPTAVAAICAEIDGERVGMAASSLTAVSLEPGLISLCVMNESRTWARLRDADRVGVSVLAADQAAACRSLGAKVGDRFAGTGTRALPGGALLLDGAALALECEIKGHLPAGDHQIALLRVIDVHADDAVEPMVYLDGAVRNLQPVAAVPSPEGATA